MARSTVTLLDVTVRTDQNLRNPDEDRSKSPQKTKKCAIKALHKPKTESKMPKRSKMNRRKSKKLFTRTAMKVNRRNNPKTIMRGGIRL